jgi:hypothetical protein
MKLFSFNILCLLVLTYNNVINIKKNNYSLDSDNIDNSEYLIVSKNNNDMAEDKNTNNSHPNKPLNNNNEKSDKIISNINTRISKVNSCISGIAERTNANLHETNEIPVAYDTLFSVYSSILGTNTQNIDINPITSNNPKPLLNNQNIDNNILLPQNTQIISTTNYSITPLIMNPTTSCNLLGDILEPVNLIEPTIINIIDGVSNQNTTKVAGATQNQTSSGQPSRNCKIQNCLECFDDNTCTKCISTDFILDGKKCVKMCPAGYIVDNTKNQCVKEGADRNVNFTKFYSIGSCRNNCGYYNIDCTCAPDCKRRGDCCSDYKLVNCDEIISKHVQIPADDMPEDCVYIEKTSETEYKCNQCRPGYLIDGKCAETCPNGFKAIDHYCIDDKGNYYITFRL